METVGILQIVNKFISPADCQRLIASYRGLLDPGQGNVQYLPLDGPEAEIGKWMMRLIPEPVALDTVLLQAILPGNFYHVEHADNIVRGGGPNHTPHRTWSALLYLNRCVGGELIFTDMGVTVTPSPGLLVVFPAHLFHKTVPVVGDVTRYLLNVWFKRGA